MIIKKRKEMIEDEIISFETAILAKDKRFFFEKLKNK